MSDEPAFKYDFSAIETKWQAHWENTAAGRVANPGDKGFDSSKPKFYVLDMFPYPSGVGLHVGHPLGYIATDIVGRYKKTRGFNVLHPMGFDAFGLPAEQFAVEHGVHPRETTEANIENMVRQLKQLGLGYDWDRRIATTDVEYYRWTQWIFLKLFDSYFDPIQKKALPISQLVAKLEQEDYWIGLDGQLINSGAQEDLEAVGGMRADAKKWFELDKDQQERLIDAYRLAFLDEVPVNWCPRLGTVLANEEVTADNRSERGNHPVFKRPLKQWMLRITEYSDRLIDDLDGVAWPEATKQLQRNWIGKSKGAEVDFKIEGSDESLRVYTTRPDTLFGATYMVLAPEHELVEHITTDDQKTAVQAYQKEAATKADVDRQVDSKEKTGVFTGAYAKNPVNGQDIPIWIADYVLTGYGTGAIMAVPAHDVRDYAFAKAFDLPIVEVVSGGDIEKEAFTGDGPLVNSVNGEISLDGQGVAEAKPAMIAWLESKGIGQGKTQYKLRDWLFSRQRYWGEPFPILHELDAAGNRTGAIRGVPTEDLPVELPPMEDFRPSGSDDPDAPVRPPLGRAEEAWRIVELDGKTYERELNTMPQWAGSCWYYLRYLDPRNGERFVGEDIEKYWMLSKKASSSGGGGYHNGGVDLYVGGVEHAVLHLLYARFWHKVLFDLGYVSTPEPFGKLFNQGYIQAYAYTDDRGMYVEASKVVNQDGVPAFEVQGKKGQSYTYEGRSVTERYGKMGKSLKNAVSPDEVCEQFGADTLRLYEMYLGPLEQSKPWSTKDTIGVHRFLQRVWRNFVNDATGELLVTEDAPDDALNKSLHKTIAGVTDDMEHMRFNTAIAKLIELNNQLTKLKTVPRAVAEAVIVMLSPMAPHISEEVWEKLGHSDSVTSQPWPGFDASLLVEDSIELPVQINGKVKAKIQVAADSDQAACEALAKQAVAEQLEGKTIRKVIVVPKRMVNIVAN